MQTVQVLYSMGCEPRDSGDWSERDNSQLEWDDYTYVGLC